MTIQILPARLANQIAAGEVVERPASVVKELIENSLDSGATIIEVDIHKGGSKSIRIRDNGCGIIRDELALALSRHATSKVSSFDDLENITSLGFRGEALASISSVSRLKLTSKPADQNEAWQAYAEGRDMQVKVIPAAHPDGTTIEVTDLFFNTPARRKFLRTEKTEFNHIDEVVKRIALSRFDVQFSLTHNGKSIRLLRRAMTEVEQDRRIGQVCGKSLLDTVLRVHCDYDDVVLSGWVALPHGCRHQNDVQFSYVNGRMMRDKLINHAIRQAYGSRLNELQYPTYVLFINVDPRQIDVNVHPAKHEVRFHQARLIHDFIVQALEKLLCQQEPCEQDLSQQELGQQELGQQGRDDSLGNVQPKLQVASSIGGVDAQSLVLTESGGSCQARKYPLASAVQPHTIAEPAGRYDVTPVEPSHMTSAANNTQSGFSGQYQSNQPSRTELKSYHQALASFTAPVAIENTLSVIDEIQPHALHQSLSQEVSQDLPQLNPQIGQNGVCLAVVKAHYGLYRCDDELYLLDLNKVNAMGASQKYAQGMVGQPLLLPVKIAQDKETLVQLTANISVLNRLGLEFECLDRHVVVRKVPALIRNSDISQIVNDLFALLMVKKDLDEQRLWLDCLGWLVEFHTQQSELDLAGASRLIYASKAYVTQQTLLERCAVVMDFSSSVKQLSAVK
jgi:DNA mismatch repair protein MutL